MSKNNKPNSGKSQLTSGKILIAIGFIVFFPVFIMSRVNHDSDAEPLIWIGKIFGFAMLSLGSYLHYRGRQLASKAATETILTGLKPDVLYLRSFKKDSSMGNYVSKFAVTPRSVLANIITEEEQLAEVLKPFGKMVAIGKPGEELPTPGAARIYAGDNWKDVVAQLMADAKLVIIRVGEGGKGLEDEIKYAIKYVPFNKLLFYVGMKKKGYKIFRNEMEESVCILFPEIPNPFKPVEGFFRFSKGLKLEYLPLQKNFLRSSGFRGKFFVTPIQYALKPVFEDFGIPWKKPPLSKIAVISAAIATFFILALCSLMFK